MASITVVIAEPPYGKERLYTTLRFVLAALADGHPVNLFLLEDAVFAARKGQKPPELPGLLDERMPNCEELLKTVVRQGAQVKACGVCCTERAVTQDQLVEGVKIASMRDLVNWVVETDKVVFF
ncbi:MAG: DsrE family protein [candidate division KSB1 bacterium]|nr:DsrE family protein [candidate division KSB1 bacterium]